MAYKLSTITPKDILIPPLDNVVEVRFSGWKYSKRGYFKKADNSESIFFYYEINGKPKTRLMIHYQIESIILID
jgi:hypothetical protein